MGRLSSRSWLILVLLLVINLISNSSCASKVELVNHGYINLVVAITEDAPIGESNKIIENIKDMITNASKVLHYATKNRVYFQAVKILLPQTWSHIEANSSSWETVNTADIVIEAQNPQYGDMPYTLQPSTKCGDPGERIHFTPNYVVTIGQKKNFEDFGNPGKVFVHEWAHYRFGVYDEYGKPGDPKYPLFFRQGNIINPNVCHDAGFNFKVIDISNNSTSCKTDPSTNLYDANCRYIFDDNYKPSSSLLSDHKLESVVHFCEDNQIFTHNFRIKTMQNEFCSTDSVWKVIERHSDCNPVLNKGIVFRGNFPPVNFEIVRSANSTRFVVVADVSRSMSNFNRIDKLGEAVRSWIMNDVPNGSQVGMVKFSSDAFIVCNITKITDEDSRKILTDKIPKDLMGATCIGCGLEMALEMLTTDPNEKGGIIVLVTDGEHTMSRTPTVNAMFQPLKEAGIRVVTVGFGSEADPDLEKLVDITGGKSYHINDVNTNSEAIRTAFLGALTYQSTISNSNLEFKLFEDNFNTSGVIDFQFEVDHTARRNLKLTVSNLESADILAAITLTGPNGEIVNQIQFDSKSTAFVNVNLADAGKWSSKIEYKSSQNSPVVVTVTAQLLPNSTTPIKTKCWIPNGANIHDVSKDPITIYAQVLKGLYPVVNATVRAYIMKPDDSVEVVNLLDNGNAADITKNDGIYSKHLTNITQKGRYTVTCQVINSGTASATLGSIGSANPSNVPQNVWNATIPLENFSRVALVGSFKVDIPVPKDDPYPPGDIRDLSVSLIRKTPTNVTVEVKWTAPGDDLDSGKVSNYELKYSDDETALHESNFVESSLNTSRRSIILSEEDLIAGSLDPKEAGSQQSATFLLVDVPREKNVYVALRAVDESEKASRVSNVGVLFIEYDDLDQIVTYDSKSDNPEDHAISIMVAGFGAVLIVIFFALLFLAVFKCILSKSKWYSVVPTKSKHAV